MPGMPAAASAEPAVSTDPAAVPAASPTRSAPPTRAPTPKPAGPQQIATPKPQAPNPQAPTPQAQAPTPTPKAAPAARIPASPQTAAPQAAASPASPASQDTPASPGVKPAVASPLDLKSLEARLKETPAIGLFTKIALKNQIDDLLERFRAFYAGRIKTSLADLRRSFDLLVMKTLALLQDADPPLAGALASSRESIWGILSDPAKFATI